MRIRCSVTNGECRLCLASKAKVVEMYDFIILGGGSAGCALANRLTRTRHQVLLRKRAGPIISKFVHSMPAGFSFPMGLIFTTGCTKRARPHLGQRRVFHAWGRFTVVFEHKWNIFQRGNPLDMEAWAASRNGHMELCPHVAYFKKLESCMAGGDQWRGDDGPLKLEQGREW